MRAPEIGRLAYAKKTYGPLPMSTADQIPQEVLDALEISLVSGIEALRSIRGLGLYEAKLVIDAYLQEHPEHRISQQMRAGAQDMPLNDGLPRWGEIVTAEPVAGEVKRPGFRGGQLV